MKKLSKRNEKILRNIESNLPKEQYVVLNKVKMFGSDLLKGGYSKEEADKIDPAAEYVVKIPGTVSINHFRRMKRLFTQHGPTELYKYLVKYVKQERRPEVLKYIHSMEH